MADSLIATHTYSDPGIDRNQSYDYELSVRIDANGLAYCLLDTNTNKYLHLEYYDLADPGRKVFIPGENEPADINRLEKLMDNDLRWLTGPFRKINVIIDRGKATLIPQALFEKKDLAHLYNFNVAGGPYDAADLAYNNLKNSDAVAIFYIPPSFRSFINKYFSDASVYHYSSAIIQGLTRKYLNIEDDNMLFVNTGRSRLDIIRLKGKRLDYYNSFIYNTAEDFMYYLIFVVEQLGLNPESVSVKLMGYIDKHSTLSDMVHKYVRNVSFIERNSDFRYSFVFDQLPGHYYFNLLNTALCE